MCNTIVDALENVVDRLSPLRNNFSIEIIYKPSIPDNITNLCVFNDEQHILHFMANTDVFKDVDIEEDEHEKSLQNLAHTNKEYPILKGMVSLKNMYDL